MRYLFITLIFTLLLPFTTLAVVELAPPGQAPTLIEEVYLHQGIPYLGIDELLDIIEIKGDWDAIAHVYELRLPDGKVTISPGSSYLRFGEKFIPLKNKPRFIDGKLRVAEDFVTVQLPRALGYPLYYRNLNPPAANPVLKESTLEGFFSFLSRKKKTTNIVRLRALAIDPGHGGNDPGVLNDSGIKEKDVTLAVADRLARLTKMKLGVPVYLSRDNDYALSPAERVKPALQPDVDAFLILHAQAAFDHRPQGIRLFIRPEELTREMGGEALNDSLRLARELAKAVRVAGFTVGEIRPAPLLPLGRGDLPTVLIELGYLTNPDDATLLTSPEARDELVAALYAGLDGYINDTSETP